MRHLEETYSLLWSWLKDGDDDDNGDMWFCGCNVLLILSLEEGGRGCEVVK